jgi:hypothetical protein
MLEQIYPYPEQTLSEHVYAFETPFAVIEKRFGAIKEIA